MSSETIRVLIVDGMLDRDDHIEETLLSAGIATRVANDSMSASGVLDVWRPTVAVVDLRTPSSEARRFCTELAARPNRADLPVVLVAEGPNLLKWLPVIPAGLVPTPVNADHLIATVVRVARESVSSERASVATR